MRKKRTDWVEPDDAAPAAAPADPVRAAVEAYRIPGGGLVSSAVDRETGTVTLVTRGGIKLRWRAGEMLDARPDMARIMGGMGGDA